MLSTYDIIKKLGFERLAGTYGEQKAREIIISLLRESNLKPIEEFFELYTFSDAKGSIKVNNEVFDIVPFGLNETVSMESELVFLDNPEILKYDNSYKNKIIVSNIYSRKITDILSKSKIAAFIYISSPNKKATSLSHRQYSYEKGYTHCATISYEDAEKLHKYNMQKVRLDISQKVKKTKSANIIVDIKGKLEDSKTVIVGGHYDSVSRSYGASDNAAGTAILIKIAEYFSKNKPLRNLRIIFFSGEELGLLGSQAYVKKHTEEIKKSVLLMVNIDVSGDFFGKDKFVVIGTKEHLGYVNGITREIGMMFLSSLDIYSSDCMPFSIYEIPSVNIARFGGKGSSYAHTPDDIPENVSPQGLKNTQEAAINLLKHILNAKVFPLNKEIDSNLKEKIIKYLYNLTGKEIKLDWEPNYKK